jgi:hypothetical protein
MATYSYSECIVHIAFPLQQWLRERALMLHLCVHSLSCYGMPPSPSHGERFASTVNADSVR